MRDVYNPPLDMIKYRFNEKEKIGKIDLQLYKDTFSFMMQVEKSNEDL